jgi:hypothetical protein
MSSFLIIKEERGILYLSAKGLSLKEEGTFNIILNTLIIYLILTPLCYIIIVCFIN